MAPATFCSTHAKALAGPEGIDARKELPRKDTPRPHDGSEVDPETSRDDAQMSVELRYQASTAVLMAIWGRIACVTLFIVLAFLTVLDFYSGSVEPAIAYIRLTLRCVCILYSFES